MPQGEGFTTEARVLHELSEERGLSEEATTVVDASLLRTPMSTHFPLHRCHRCFSQSLSLRRLFPCSAPDTSKCPARPWSSFASPPSRGHPILSGGKNAKHGTIGSTNRLRAHVCHSTMSSDDYGGNNQGIGHDGEDGDSDGDEFLTDKGNLQPQGVDPKRGWNFRGVHKAIICGKVGQPPMQKILRNGRTITIFTVGTAGMYDQRLVNSPQVSKPAQWHRIAVHNTFLGSYAVQQLVKNSSVFVEGDIETRVYNDSITGQVKNIPEICVRRDGKIRLIKAGVNVGSISLDDIRESLP